jgi:hypothetical protein
MRTDFAKDNMFVTVGGVGPMAIALRYGHVGRFLNKSDPHGIHCPAKLGRPGEESPDLSASYERRRFGVSRKIYTRAGNSVRRPELSRLRQNLNAKTRS